VKLKLWSAYQIEGAYEKSLSLEKNLQQGSSSLREEERCRTTFETNFKWMWSSVIRYGHSKAQNLH